MILSLKCIHKEWASLGCENRGGEPSREWCLCFYPHVTQPSTSLSIGVWAQTWLCLSFRRAEPAIQGERRAGGEEPKGHTIERKDIL